MSFDPERTAVVAVHAQNDVVGADGARAAGATVVYTRVVFQPGHTDLSANSPLSGMVAQTRCLEDGSTGAAIADELAPRDGDKVVTHNRVGGFHDSDLDATLRAAGVDTVVFAGVATNASVEGTARVASDLGYRTVVVADACSAGSDAAHSASLESLSLFAEITTTDELPAGLSQPAGATA